MSSGSGSPSGVHVTGVLTADQQAFAREVAAQARQADGVAPLSEQSLAAIDRAEPAVRHVISDVGYGNILPGRDGEPSMIEVVVAPKSRRQGHGRALLEAALVAARSDNGAPPRVWAHGDLPGAVALADTLRLSRRRELLQLRRSMHEPLDSVVVDPSLLLRTYEGPADEPEILRVNNAAFDWHPEQGGWTAEDIAERVRSDWFDPAGLFLVFDAGDPTRLLGFHWTKMQSPELGEVYIVGVDPAAQGRGLGRLLTLAGLHHLADRGVTEVELYVEGDNTAALHTYHRLGFTRYAIDVAYG